MSKLFTFVFELVLNCGKRVVFFGEQNRKLVFIEMKVDKQYKELYCLKLKEIPYAATVLANNNNIIVIG